MLKQRAAGFAALIRSRPVKFLAEPLIAAVLFCCWLLVSAPPIVDYVPMRSETSMTNPYPVVVALAFCIALAVSRLSPAYSLAIAVLAVSSQLVGWAARLSNTGWTAYLILLAVVVAIALHSVGRLRVLAIAMAVPVAVAISALLTFPSLSLSGEWGLINGKPWTSSEVLAGFAIWAAAQLIVGTALWRISSRLRPLPADHSGPSSGTSNVAALSSLSPRERDVYLWVASGMTNAEIAAAAHIEESTVKTHISNVLSKLGLSSRTGIVAHAYRSGALTPEAASVAS